MSKDEAVRRGAEDLGKFHMEMGDAPAGDGGEFGDGEWRGVVLLDVADDALDGRGEILGLGAAGVVAGFAKEDGVEVMGEDIAGKGLVHEEGDSLAGEGVEFFQVLPEEDARRLADGRVGHLETDGKAAVGVGLVAAGDGSLSYFVPEEVTGADFAPVFLVPDPTTAPGEDLHDLDSSLQVTRAGLNAGSLVVMRDSDEVGGEIWHSRMSAKVSDIKSYFSAIRSSCESDNKRKVSPQLPTIEPFPYENY